MASISTPGSLRPIAGALLIALLCALLTTTAPPVGADTPARDDRAARTLSFSGQTPQLRGAGHVGTRLRITLISKKDFSPRARTLRYRWLRRGELIPGARKKYYRIAEKDRARRLKAVVIAERPGYRARRVKTNMVKVAR